MVVFMLDAQVGAPRRPWTRQINGHNRTIAVMAAREFVGGRGLASLRWSLECLRNGLADLFLQRTVRVKLKERAFSTASNPDPKTT
jgi:hypothetical protein